MKIFIDIGHPAHVHYFKNFIRIMKNNGHEFLITARDKECTFELLDHYQISYISRGKGEKGKFGKFLNLLKTVYFIRRLAKSFDPNLMISFASPYLAQASWLLRRPHIALDDTEHAWMGQLFYVPFTRNIITPQSFQKNLGSKHEKINSFMEISYLHPNYFDPDPSIFELLEIKKNEKFVLLRFIAWDAHHDSGHQGLRNEIKIKAVKEFSKYAKVFISSEAELPEELQRFKINIPAYRMHDVLYYAQLYFGESGTMATESAILGTPTVRVSSLAKLLGNFKELSEDYNLVEFYDSDELGYQKALELLKSETSKIEWQAKAKALLKDKIDVTNYLVNYTKNKLNE
jgi:predicted glycosyltransferase